MTAHLTIARLPLLPPPSNLHWSTPDPSLAAFSRPLPLSSRTGRKRRAAPGPLPVRQPWSLHGTPPSSSHPPSQYQPYPRQRHPIAASSSSSPIRDIRYSQFLSLVKRHKIERVTIDSDGTQLIGQLSASSRKRSWISKLFPFFHRKSASSNISAGRIRINQLPNDPDLLPTLTKHHVDIVVSSPPSSAPSILSRILFPMTLFASLFFLLRKSSSNGNILSNKFSPLSLSKMKPAYNFQTRTNLTFSDVAGCDQAKLELSEIVDFLKHPITYLTNGCRIPKGVLLYGPPGTGKTLLAKAVAGEASVPFVSVSGSEFVELYVGVGASRVRELYFQAKRNAPCIVFLDEVDAVGRQRGAGFAGGNDEREQTMNQILVEMDGYEGDSGVITLAATNRLDVLDEALLRPGRFDRKVAVDLPDVGGRRKILDVHSRGKPMESDVDLDAVARRTPGFSGAELENLMNEAALSAVRGGKSTIGWMEVDGALDRLMVGMEKRGGAAYLSQELKELVAYHEAGHAIVGSVIPDYDYVQKVTIVPRSNGAGGLTFFSPQESRLETGLYSKQYLESQLVVALGGRVAEEIIFGENKVTIGATNDLEHVASIAKQMVKEFGMSNALGPIALSSPNRNAPFMGRSLVWGRRNVWGTKILSRVDSEVERLVTHAYVKAKAILTENIDLLHHLANTLIEQEMVTAEELQYMLLMFDAKMVEYKVMGDERLTDKLPFRDLPKDV
ncbi:hypothetical protein HJC23_003356 [Cyclotella cryptica]|uniref:AAA+ ATPase domain-containing protein n=1 Tax=Cyclotella cryptica TaxID=29204 RepID=A0ABD3QXG1_9STRA|eukprot:CCRYP_000930-RA/>CCRYP_000930-RA protein AED:0.09 eAED:0.09 QI:0/-1/0/1/-1/1/1/0/727